MNNFTQMLQQLAALWKQLGLNQRISVVLAAGVVILGLAGLVMFSTRVDYALLYGKLEDAEAAKVIAALDDAKVPYKISRGGGTISVPADKVHLMRMQLAAKGIPRAGEGVGFEILDKPNFGISDFVQRANYLRAVQGELARTIGQIDSVESARVMIVMPENRLLVENQKRPTASVFVRIRGNAPLPQQTVNAMRFLVANAVEGLQPNMVAVMDNQGNLLSENNEDDTIVGLTLTQLNARKNMEAYLAKKAQTMLDQVLGAGQSVVRVSAEINYDTSTRTEEKFDPDGQVLRTSTLNDETVDSTTVAPPEGGAPGTQVNANTDTNNVAATPATSNRTRKKIVNSQYEINRQTSNYVQAAGALHRVSVAVVVAARYDSAGPNRKIVPRTPKELDQLTHIVQSALGIQDGTDAALRKDEIKVEEIVFNDQPAMELEKKMDQEQTKDFWMNLAHNAVYPLLALVILFTFWRIFKRTPETLPIGVAVGEVTHNGSTPKDAVISVDALNQMIRENPANMTHAIRAWMQNGKK